jgi:hypothetical protein
MESDAVNTVVSKIEGQVTAALVLQKTNQKSIFRAPSAGA